MTYKLSPSTPLLNCFEKSISLTLKATKRKELDNYLAFLCAFIYYTDDAMTTICAYRCSSVIVVVAVGWYKIVYNDYAFEE